MATIRQMRQLLDIIEKYAPKGEDAWPIAGADHDVVYLDLPEVDLTDEENALLSEIGVHRDEYDEGWEMFV